MEILLEVLPNRYISITFQVNSMGPLLLACCRCLDGSPQASSKACDYQYKSYLCLNKYWSGFCFYCYCVFFLCQIHYEGSILFPFFHSPSPFPLFSYFTFIFPNFFSYFLFSPFFNPFFFPFPFSISFSLSLSPFLLKTKQNKIQL